MYLWLGKKNLPQEYLGTLEYIQTHYGVVHGTSRRVYITPDIMYLSRYRHVTIYLTYLR